MFQRKNLPSDLTSYDFLKSVAIVLMIIDHLGAYFFPEEMWLRALGRICVPMWFFLIGYARTRDIPNQMWIGALIIMSASPLTGAPFFPINILVTMIAVRLSLDYLMAKSLESPLKLWGISILLLFLIIPTYVLSDYGTIGFFLAMFGYCVRLKQDKGDDRVLTHFMLFSAGSLILVSQMVFAFSTPQFVVMSVGIVLTILSLQYFKPMTFPDLSNRLPWGVKGLIQLTGRRTLEIYVIHLVLFKILALMTGIEGFEFLTFRAM